MRTSFALLGLASLIVAMLSLPAAAAAAGCDLTTAISPGHVITITGSGFPAGATVEITQTWSGSNATAGGNTGPQTTHSQATADASGGFAFTIDAGPGLGGTYDIEATGGGCTATAHVTALETAGGVNPGSGGTSVTPPPTDADAAGSRPNGSAVPALPLLGVAAAGLGAFLLAIARTRRSKA